MSENEEPQNTVFALEGQQIGTIRRDRSRTWLIGILITEKPYYNEYILGAWNYAVRQTNVAMEPDYPAAIKWLREKHPEWEIRTGQKVIRVQFDLNRNGLQHYTPPE